MSKKTIISLIFLLTGSFFISKPTLGMPIQENTQQKIIEVYVQGEVKEEKIILEKDFTFSALLDKITLTSQANLEGFDLKQKLNDEMTIYIPSKQAKISLNKASKEELMQIKGIGEVIASRILEYRAKQPFYFIEEIKKIKGIGEKKYLNYRNYLCLSFFFHYPFLF